MNVISSALAGISVVALQGNLTIDSVAAAKSEILAALADVAAVQLDLSAVRECDTAGVQLILLTKVEACRRGLVFSAPNQSTAFRTAAQRIGISSGVFEQSNNGASDRD